MSSRISTLVTTKWLANKLASNPIKFRLLDGSWHLPNTGRDPKAEYLQNHIRGAQFFDIEDCSDKSSDYSHMLPSAEVFQKYAGKLGICNQTHVVIYDNSEKFGMLSAQRVWWTFRIFGHNDVSILDGGLPKWISEGYETTKDVDQIEPKLFNAALTADMVTHFEDMQKNINEQKFTVIDARPNGRFMGISPEPREGIEPGHMPNAVNIPFTEMLNEETKVMKTPEEIKRVFKEKGVNLDLDKRITATCGSGISACLLVLGAHGPSGIFVPRRDTSFRLNSSHINS